jgi:asparagine synthase (glutamine-hydrolysing)
VGALAVVLRFGNAADEEAAGRMLLASPHRGEPVATASVGGAALGVSHTAELDDASLASDADLAVVCNGDLDNLDELAIELGLPSHGITPARVFLEAFRRWGDAASDRVRGPFAAVVTDGRTLWCTRDIFGARALFLRRESEAVYVASEVKQVMAGAGRPCVPDVDVVESLIYAEFDDDTPTALEGAERVPRGMVLRADARGAARRRYWDPMSILETARLSDDEVVEGFHSVMTRSARRALLGDEVISLSGGLDSATVASYAAPLHLARTGRPLPALSVVYPRFPDVDERPYIEMVAGFLGLELHTYEEDSKSLDDVETWMSLIDTALPRYYLTESAEHYRRARKLGFRTMLTGEFAEYLIERRGSLLSYLLLHGRVGALVDHVREQRRERGVPATAIVRQLAAALFTPRMEATWARVRPAALVTPPWLDDARLRATWARYATPARERWARHQTGVFMGPDLAAEADEVVQAVTGLRVRRPFMDRDVAEFFLRLPAEQKFPDTHFKGLLRRAMRGRLPDTMLDTPSKVVFNDAVEARADHEKMRALIAGAERRMRGVDYDLLIERLESGDLDMNEYMWAHNIAAAHAFLARG